MIAAALLVIAVVTLMFGWFTSRVTPRLAASQSAAGDTVAAAQKRSGFKVIVAAGGQQGVLASYTARSAAGRDRGLAVSRLALWFEPAPRRSPALPP